MSVKSATTAERHSKSQVAGLGGSKPVRHVMGISGGKDSAALAVFMARSRPIANLEYFFCDTGKELPETYEYLERLEARLGIQITRLAAERGFDHWLEVKRGMLPSPRVRWCTEYLKLDPIHQFIGDDEAVSYIAIRADERRDGYVSAKPNIRAEFPLRDAGIDKAGVFRLLEESGLGLPSYYRWRTRSGCYFCFFQRKAEWVHLHDEHPDLFWKAVAYEEDHKIERVYSWSANETLRELIGRRDEILAEHANRMAREAARPRANQPLAEVLSAAFDADDDEPGCVVCHT
jgi:3'-phosphoadenosine 5'-phosphosulfate sulfotransferase (PAPS reductase)/FAD synthetase